MLRSKLTKIQDPWPRAQNAAQKRVPSPNPGSDDIHTEDGKRWGGRNSNEIQWEKDQLADVNGQLKEG